jgi:hypothetical protein
MKRCRTTAVAAIFVLWLAAVLASAATRNNMVRIRVLDSETQSVASANAVPQNCDGVNFDAHCRAGQTVEMTNTLVVQEGDGTPFRIVCTVESRWSRCVPLPKDATYTARKEKRGLVVFYPDDAGKTRSQLYTFADAQSAAAAGTTERTPAPAPAEDAGSAGEATTSSKPQTVKCSFRSNPSGADVTVDGRYVGSTPSVLGVTAGSHVVVISMAGFAEWKRDLAVSPGSSELTVNAVLQKAQ